jgi:hypothetical protein
LHGYAYEVARNDSPRIPSAIDELFVSELVQAKSGSDAGRHLVRGCEKRESRYHRACTGHLMYAGVLSAMDECNELAHAQSSHFVGALALPLICECRFFCEQSR